MKMFLFRGFYLRRAQCMMRVRVRQKDGLPPA